MTTRRTKRPTGTKHPNATLTKSQVSKIWKLSEENGWGSRRIAVALNLPENKRGVVEKILYGLSYRDCLPESKRPKGICVNDRGDEIRVWDSDAPTMVVVIRDGVARCTGYDVDSPVPNAAAMNLADFAAVVKGFEFINPEQRVLDALKAGKERAKRRVGKS